jgi:hypothetical protein
LKEAKMKKSLFTLGFIPVFITLTNTQVFAVNNTTVAKTKAAQSSATSVGVKNYDVILDVPNVSVESIKLEVDKLRALLSLDARVANLVQLTAGADVSIDKVSLEIKGVKAEAHLRVSLDNVAAIVNRTLDTLDRNPKLLESVGKTLETVGQATGRTLDNVTRPGGVLDNTLNNVTRPGGVLDKTLDNVTRPGGILTQTVNTLGQTLNRTVDMTGNILESTLDKAGNILNSKTVGNILDLQVLKEVKNASGQIVRQVRDQTGKIIEYTLDSTGKVINTQVLK